MGASEGPRPPHPPGQSLPVSSCLPGRTGGPLITGNHLQWGLLWVERTLRKACVCVRARAGAHACACVRECARTPVQKVQLLCPPACERVSLRPCLTYSAAPRPPRAIAGVDHECLKSGLFPKSCVPFLWLAGEMGVGASRPSPASADDYCTWTASSFLEVYLYCHFITLWPLS